jgi:hypothetical protein
VDELDAAEIRRSRILQTRCRRRFAHADRLQVRRNHLAGRPIWMLMTFLISSPLASKTQRSSRPSSSRMNSGFACLFFVLMDPVCGEGNGQPKV